MPTGSYRYSKHSDIRTRSKINKVQSSTMSPRWTPLLVALLILIISVNAGRIVREPQRFGRPGRPGYGNQGFGNQGFGNQGFGNQGGNQGFGNQGFGNQGFGNQGGNQGQGFGGGFGASQAGAISINTPFGGFSGAGANSFGAGFGAGNGK
ncbi:uncharacterized protein LOC128989498 [Macrosteles quadrilineatus]|uniref:uncharacterized protein LOC128989498 n=1 Tax=Macrosteles quadrilineatus TaxID=74068 RepID=UPI0023E0DD19|nr:uncharacterized protein LOC128989498 [Macrosteles quadrilineatus]